MLLSFISLGLFFLFLARLWISDCTASEWRSDACSDSETPLFFYIFLKNIPHHDPFCQNKLEYLFTTKLEKNWSR